MSFIQQFFTSRDNNANAETFVGQEGRLWWDPVTNQIYSSDGNTPGGIPLAGGGGGNGTPGGSNSQVQFNNSGTFGGSANLTFNRVNGALTAVSFVGDGSALSNITAANVVGEVSNATYASSAVNAINAETVTANSQPNITGVGILSSLSVSGNVDAAYFIGNGSQLTGISSSSNRIFNGTSNVEIATANGNATITTNGANTWTFDTVGNLNLPGGGSIYHNENYTIITGVDGSELNWAGVDGGATVGAEDTAAYMLAGSASGTSNVVIYPNSINATSTGNINIISNANTWTFDTTGNLTLPGNLGANNAGITSINAGEIVNLRGQANGIVGIKAYGSAANLVAGVAVSGSDSETGRVTVSVFNPAIDDSEYWTFNTAGDFTTGTGNIFFGTNLGDPVIVPGSTSIKIAADRDDVTSNYISIGSSGIIIDALGGSSADIRIRASDDVFIAGGDKTANPGQTGGVINIDGGQGGPDNGFNAGDGGDVNIQGGLGGDILAGGAGDGGEVFIGGGSGSTANVVNSLSAGAGGPVTIYGGEGGQNDNNSALSNQGGNVDIYGGQGSFDFGNSVPNGDPGHVNIYGGNWGFVTPSGNIYLNGYDGTNFKTLTYDNAGNVTMAAGGSLNFVGTSSGIVQSPNNNLVIRVQDDENAAWSLYNRVTDAGNTLAETRLKRDSFSVAFPNGAGNFTFANTGNLTAPGVITANTFISNAFDVVTAGNLSITSQYGLGVTGTILEQGGTLELIGNGTGAGTTGCVVVGWNSSYGTAGNVAQIYLNPADSTGNIVVTTGNTAATNYQWNFDNTGNLAAPGAISAAGNITGGNMSVSGAFYGNFYAPGVDTQIVFNDNNFANADAGFTYNKTTETVSVGNTVSASNVSVTNTISGNIISASGNITGGNIVGTHVGNITGATASLSGNVTGGNLRTSGVLNLTGGTPYTTVALSGGNIILNNGASDTPGLHFYQGNNDNFGIDVEASTLRFVKNLDEAGGVVIGRINANGNISAVGQLQGASASVTGNVTGGNLTVTGNATITYTPATTAGYGITVNAANTQGGTGYADFLRATNTSGGATNPNKSFRLSSAGALEIINSAYSATLLSLSDAGAMSAALPYQVAGKQAVNGPAFSAYAAAILQNIPNGVQTKVLFQTEEFDTNNNYASSRFTPTVEGYYQLNAEVRIDGATGTGECMIILYKNGSEYKRGWNSSGTQFASNFWAMTVSSVAYANGTGDYFEIYVQQGSGGTLAVTAVNAPAITWFNGCMLRGA